MSKEAGGKKDKEGGFLSRMMNITSKPIKPVQVSGSEDSFNAAIENANANSNPTQAANRADIAVDRTVIHAVAQTEIALRDIPVETDPVEVRTVGILTDVVGIVDRDVGTEPVGMWDREVMCAPFMKDQAVDIGEWNNVVFHGIEAQTDAPDSDDALFWCTGNGPEIHKLMNSLMRRVREEYLKDPRSMDETTLSSTQLLADNLLLRLEVEELKSRLKKTCLNTEPATVDRSPTMQRNLVGGLIDSGFPKSVRYVVVADEGVLVTSSLAPSSFVLGKVRKGDKVLSAGSPEEILGKYRVPVLPRGWVTVKDKERILLEGLSLHS